LRPNSRRSSRSEMLMTGAPFSRSNLIAQVSWCTPNTSSLVPCKYLFPEQCNQIIPDWHPLKDGAIMTARDEGFCPPRAGFLLLSLRQESFLQCAAASRHGRGASGWCERQLSGRSTPRTDSFCAQELWRVFGRIVSAHCMGTRRHTRSSFWRVARGRRYHVPDAGRPSLPGSREDL
jgi:hypothetical protein